MAIVWAAIALNNFVFLLDVIVSWLLDSDYIYIVYQRQDLNQSGNNFTSYDSIATRLTKP